MLPWRRSVQVAFLLLVVSLSSGAVGAVAASTPTPASGWISAVPCVRPARTAEVASWIETPGPIDAPVIQKTTVPTSGAWQPPTVALADLPTGPEASADVKAAIQQVLVDVSACAAFPGDGVDAYFSDDFFRRTMVVAHRSATPGNATPATSYSWGFVGIGASSESPVIKSIWELPGGRVGAAVKLSPDRAQLFIVFVEDPKTGHWLIDEMAYLSHESGTPSS